MALYKVNQGNKKLELQTPSNFVTEKVLERKDLQPLIRDNMAAIDTGLFLLAEEFDDLAGAARRVDLLALDSSRNLVVIELKRVDDGSHMELQSLRYAAMLSALTFEDVVKIYETHLTKSSLDASKARAEIETFLNPTNGGQFEISNSPRIVLISPGFSQEVTQTVLWLNAQGLDIRCFELKLYVISSQKYIEIEQVIPLPTAAQYQFALQNKANKQRAVSGDAGPRTVNALVTAGVLQDQQRIALFKPPVTGYDASNLPPRVRQATYVQQSGKFRWDEDDKEYTLAGLTTALYRHIGGTNVNPSFRGSDYWSFEGEAKSMTQRANELLLADSTVPTAPTNTITTSRSTS